MDNHKIFSQLSRLHTSDLLIAKMECIKEIALYKSLRLGFLGLMSIFVGHLAKVVLATQAVSWIEWSAALLVMLCLAGYWILDELEASEHAKKALVDDLILYRINKGALDTGTPQRLTS